MLLARNSTILSNCNGIINPVSPSSIFLKSSKELCKDFSCQKLWQKQQNFRGECTKLKITKSKFTQIKSIQRQKRIFVEKHFFKAFIIFLYFYFGTNTVFTQNPKNVLESGKKASSSPVPELRQAPELESKLREIYAVWRRSVLAKDYKTWEKTVADDLRIEVRNRIVSRKRPYPQSIFKNATLPSAIDKHKCLRVWRWADKARMVIFGDLPFQEQKEQKKIKNSATKTRVALDGKTKNKSENANSNALIIKYSRANGFWRFAGAEFVNLNADQNSRATRSRLLAGELSPLVNPPFLPNLAVREQDRKRQNEPTNFGRKKLCPLPDYVGLIVVDARNCAIDLRVNESYSRRIDKQRLQDLIIGGLRKGENFIELKLADKRQVPGLLATLRVGVYAQFTQNLNKLVFQVHSPVDSNLKALLSGKNDFLRLRFDVRKRND